MTEGFATTPSTRKRHYYRNQRSLCPPRYMLVSTADIEDQNVEDKENCSECARRIYRELNKGLINPTPRPKSRYAVSIQVVGEDNTPLYNEGMIEVMAFSVSQAIRKAGMTLVQELKKKESEGE